MSSLNKVMILGRLGRDPELKYTQTGAPICNLSVATDESYTDRDGQKVSKVEWHRVQVWNKAAENCNTYLAKGSLVLVEGSLTTRKWQDQNGQDRYTTEIKAQNVQFLDRKGEGGQSDGQQPPPQRQAPRQQNLADGYAPPSDIDPIPF